MGRPFTIGAIELQTPTAQPAQVDAVSVMGASAGMRLVHVYAAGVPGDTGRQGAWAATSDWPPPGETLRPLSARPVPARSAGASRGALQIVLELELTRGRRATFRQVTIGYHIGSARYRQTWPLAVRACAPGVRCDAPDPPNG